MTDRLTIPQSTLDAQFAASNPENSAWVSANAGSGKTHVLTQRVIRLMLAGNPPDKILCLTFTKAAAANMKNRVFETLAKWTMMEAPKLADEIRKSTGLSPSHKLLHRARQLFAEALDTPGGLKIQTIHAFCEALLHQFPLEANVSGHFEVLQDTAQTALLQEARAKVLSGAGDNAIVMALGALVPRFSDQAIEEAIAAIIGRRSEFTNWLHDVGLEGGAAQLAAALGVNLDDSDEQIKQDALDQIAAHDACFRLALPLAREAGGKRNEGLVENLVTYFGDAESDLRLAAIKQMSLTGKNEIRAAGGLSTKPVKDALPELVESIQVCGEIVLAALDKMQSLRLIQNSHNLFVIAKSVLEEYERMKRRRGLIDYDDQIERCVNLLQRADIRGWIRYRLDRGIDHVLVDEAQDTSPAQWQIIKSVTDDFHSGDNAAVRSRTEFVVGDEKQSIYSFQGADPREFDKQAHALAKTVTAAGKPFRPVRLNLSFRSTPDVLGAVDAVFSDDGARKGLTQDGERPIHDAVRSADPGEVQVWPIYAKPDTPEPENWLDPIDREGDADPAVVLAERISKTISEWVGKPLPGTGKPLKYQDILVLVRKRDRFITALTRTMKDHGLSVAGADRLKLMDHIAVEDLVAIGRFVLLPEDDLNLACVLKGFHFGLDDEALYPLCQGRGKLTVLERIRSLANDTPDANSQIASEALGKLDQLLAKAAELDVFDFYAWLLGEAGGRRAILARLGMEAEDVVDAFLDELLTFARSGGMGLEPFISELTNANPEIKRELELDRDEVRILTVHASKGLEARVVFLVDPCNPAWNAKHRSKVSRVDDQTQSPPFVWTSSSEHDVALTRVALEEQAEAAEAEYRRLLYVGMTRAADRLVMCGYRGKREPAHEHWHTMVARALIPDATEITNEAGEVIGHRWFQSEKPPVPPHEAAGDTSQEKQDDSTVPDWLFTEARTEPSLPRPLTPSGAYALIDRDLKTARKPAFETGERSQGNALGVGNAVHKLLEMLPGMKRDALQDMVSTYLDRVGSAWSQGDRGRVAATVLDILSDDAYADLFGESSRSEVPVVGKLETKNGTRLVSGQIDRLVVAPDLIHILDFKTGRHVPQDLTQVQPEYVGQLALYRHVIAQVYPDRPVRCSLLWTSGPELMTLPEGALDEALEAIKKG